MGWFFKETVEDIVGGNAKTRYRALVAYLSWVAMGAFVFSTIAHHWPVVGVSDATATLTGGAVAAAAAFAAKFA